MSYKLCRVWHDKPPWSGEAMIYQGALVLELERITKTTSCQREAKTT